MRNVYIHQRHESPKFFPRFLRRFDLVGPLSFQMRQVDLPLAFSGRDSFSTGFSVVSCGDSASRFSSLPVGAKFFRPGRWETLFQKDSPVTAFSQDGSFYFDGFELVEIEKLPSVNDALESASVVAPAALGLKSSGATEISFGRNGSRNSGTRTSKKQIRHPQKQSGKISSLGHGVSLSCEVSKRVSETTRSNKRPRGSSQFPQAVRLRVRNKPTTGVIVKPKN